MLNRFLTPSTKECTIVVHSITLIFLFCGLFYSIHLGNELNFPDEKVYHQLASNMVEGKGYTLDGTTPSSWRTPGYPAFLAPFMLLGANITFLRYLNFIVLAGCIYLMRAILRDEGAESGIVLSAMYVLLYGVLFYTAGTLYPQTLFTLLLLIQIRLMQSTPFTKTRAIIFGLVSAAIIMVHPTGIFLPPLLIIWLCVWKGWNNLSKGLISALVVILCFAPWWYRNYKVYNAFVPISAHGGDTLYWGNNPNTNVNAWWKSITEDVTEQTRGMSEIEEDRYYKSLAVKFWREQPGNAFKLYMKKLLHHFNFRNKYHSAEDSNFLRDLVMFTTYYPLLLCLLIRLLYIRKKPLSKIESLFILIYFSSALFHAIFLTRIRFRLPYDVVLITHVGLMFTMFTSWLKTRRQEISYKS